MYTIEATARGHQLTLTSAGLPASGSAQFDRVKFSFDSVWDGLSKVALFWTQAGEAPYAAAVDASGYAMIPWEALENRAKLQFGVYGTRPGQAAPRITSTLVKCSIPQGAWSDEIANSGSPTASLVAQFQAAAASAIQQAQQQAAENGALLQQMEAMMVQVFPKASGQGAVIQASGTIDAPIPALTLYGKSVQSGTPTPSSPAAIATAGSSGSVGIVSAGKNLIQPVADGAYSKQGMTVNVASGVCSVTGTYTGTGFNAVLVGSVTLPPGTYKLNGQNGADASNRKLTLQLIDLGGDQVCNLDAGTDYAFTVTATKTFNVRAGFRAGLNLSAPATMTPMIRLASLADAAFEEPAGATAALPTPNGLPGIPVSDGGNFTDSSGQQWICDTIDKAAGKYTQRVKAYTKTEFSAKSGNANVKSYYINCLDPALIPSNRDAPEPLLCSHAPACAISDLFNINYAGVRCGFMDDTPTVFRVSWPLSSDVDTIEAANALISGGMTFIYPLATPVTTDLTAAQLAALNGLRSRAGNTALYTDDAMAPELAAKLIIDLESCLE